MLRRSRCVLIFQSRSGRRYEKRRTTMELVVHGARQFGINLKTLWESIVCGITRGGCKTYLVTLTYRCSFLCVSGQRGTIAKSMYEEDLCVVALASVERGTQFFPLVSYFLV